MVRGFRGAVLLASVAVFLAPTPAQATDGLGWQWSADTARRWLLRAQVDLPSAMPLAARVDTDAQVVAFTLSLVVTCRMGQELGRNAWELVCDIEDASLSALPVELFRGRTLPVLEEWTAALRDQATLRLTQARHGRLRGVDLEGLPSGTTREQDIALWARLALLRALAPLDMELPKRGDDRGSGAWRQTEAMALHLVTPVGTSGGARLEHALQQEREGVVDVVVHGEGVVAEGASADGQLLHAYTMVLDGSYRFDTREGTLLESRYMAEARPTAGSVSAEGGAGFSYVQAVMLKALPADGPLPALGRPRELGASAAQARPAAPQPADPGSRD